MPGRTYTPSPNTNVHTHALPTRNILIQLQETQHGVVCRRWCTGGRRVFCVMASILLGMRGMTCVSGRCFLHLAHESARDQTALSTLQLAGLCRNCASNICLAPRYAWGRCRRRARARGGNRTVFGGGSGKDGVYLNPTRLAFRLLSFRVRMACILWVRYFCSIIVVCVCVCV